MRKLSKYSVFFGPGRSKFLYFCILPAIDFFSMFLAGMTSYKLRFKEIPNKNSLGFTQYDYKLVIFFLVINWFIFIIVSGNYKFTHSNSLVFNFRNVIKKTLVFFFFIGFLSFILKASFSRLIFILMFVTSLIYIFIFRLVFYFFVIRPRIHARKLSTRLLIIGKEKDDLDTYASLLVERPNLGFKVVNRLNCPLITSEWLNEFERIVFLNKVEELLLLPGLETDPSFAKFIHYCEDLEIHINWIPLDSGNLGYWLIPSPQEGIPFLTFDQSEMSFFDRVIKRVFDLAFSLSVMILLSPIFFLIALAVLFSSGWPVFYSQTRVGYQGKTFKFYKFRSMVKDADKLIDEVDNVHEKDHVIFKNKKDPRVTPVGRILRKYSLDELPQFLNVLNNTMSVVGPRPALPREVKVYDSIYERRLKAKPGITGPWQISGRSDLDLRTSVALDLNYLTNWSFTRDLWIIIATVGAIFKGKGAY